MALLETLSHEYPLKENSSDGIKLVFQKQGKGLNVEINGNAALIKYSSLNTAARGIGKLLAGERKISEKLPFNTFGILIDCSRNATLRVDYFKKYLCRLALMGYNMAMLYTKDAYELPGEDFFGYLRGRYTLKDLQEIDSYASTLGIEMIGSIQTLGHLEPTLQWPAYAEIKDTSSVILTSEEKSYKLIRKILEFWSMAFKSRRIHLGMDETHDLGRGRYMNLNGYKRGYDIFNDHLNKVVKECDTLKLKPIIWSDMYFRMGSSSGDYYDKSLVIPSDIKNDIPKSVQINYWDYYHDNEEFYREWIKRHREELVQCKT
ncbi:MAG: family 20 glycosylhydrolase [Victivallaceae bacterium]